MPTEPVGERTLTPPRPTADQTVTGGAEARILILAAGGRNAAVFSHLLHTAGLVSLVCANTAMLVAELDRGVSAVLLTAASLTVPEVGQLEAWLARQPTWSTLPLILLVPDPALARVVPAWTTALQGQSSLTLLEQPVRAFTLVSVMQAACQARQRQYEVRDLQTNLEQRVQARTAELARSNRELEQFALVAAHDLRTPLRGIAHLAQWIGEVDDPPLAAAAQAYLAKLRERVKRLDALLQDLLVYARAGRQPHPLQRVDTTALVQAVYAWLDPPSGFTLTLVPPLPHLVTERLPLETVLRNLIGNALKHHHQPSQGQVQVAAQRHGSWVAFSVQDNGPGLTPALQERLFEPQLASPHGAATGLGLTVVKQIVESRGGTLHVDTQLGSGTLIHFTWPTA